MNNSIIWADRDSEKSFADFTFIDMLNLETLINVNESRKLGEIKKDLREYFTVRADTIILRQEMFCELLEKPELFERLNSSFSMLSAFFDIKKEKEGAPSNEQLLFDIKILELYVEYLKDINSIFEEYCVQSTALKRIWAYIQPICSEMEFSQLCEVVDKQVHTVSHIKSITIGINLNAQMKPTEAGVVAVNEESYVSGEFINKLLRLRLNDSKYECLAPLLPMNSKLSTEELNAVRLSLNSALNQVFSTALKSWSSIVKRFVINNLQGLSTVLDEWHFVKACMNSMLDIKKQGFNLCRPTIGRYDNIKGLYHPHLALSSLCLCSLVKNDITFEEKNNIYILTGPNQGGKSIFTQAVGILNALFHLGWLLPADEVTIRIKDAILVHFIDITKRSYTNGRLADECEKIHKINSVISENSIFLFDEALSSTNAMEAVAISTEIITAYSEIGAQGIWATHFHELCGLEKKYTNGKSKVCNISAQINNDSHERSFKIVRGDGGNSYAADIAAKYNLTKSEILNNSKHKCKILSD